jgi:hypothetical protein
MKSRVVMTSMIATEVGKTLRRRKMSEEKMLASRTS